MEGGGGVLICFASIFSFFLRFHMHCIHVRAMYKGDEYTAAADILVQNLEDARKNPQMWQHETSAEFSEFTHKLHNLSIKSNSMLLKTRLSPQADTVILPTVHSPKCNPSEQRQRHL